MKIGLRPISAASNGFVELFSAALESPGRRIVDYQDSIRSLATYDVAIIHWPDEYFSHDGRLRTLKHFARLKLAKLLGMKIVWVAHNVSAHDRERAPPFVTRLFLRNLDGIIYLSRTSREIIREEYRISLKTAECVTVHGLYPPSTPQSDFLSAAGDGPVRVASFGRIRPYKNLEILASNAAQARDVELSLFGRRDDDAIASELESMAKQYSNIRTEFPATEFSDAELEARIDAAHGIVLPYQKVLNSGAALQALSRNRPILVPAIGSLPELRDEVGDEWVTLYDPHKLNTGLIEAFADKLRQARPPRPDLSAFQWSRVSSDLTNFISGICR